MELSRAIGIMNYWNKVFDEATDPKSYRALSQFELDKVRVSRERVAAITSFGWSSF